MIYLWETKRKDHLQYVSHHLATIMLIAYSYWLK